MQLTFIQDATLVLGKGSLKGLKEYSTNAHTIKSRARLAAKNGVDKLIENAKNADIQAVTRGRKKLKNDALYQAAPKDIQNKMEGEMKAAILLKRYVPPDLL